jgi:hypothetical protein
MYRLLALTLACVVGLTGVTAAEKDKEEDTPKAAKTRKLLEKKITVEFKESPLSEVVEELQEKVPGLTIIMDSKGGVSQNSKMNCAGADLTLAEILDKMFTKADMGYIIISSKSNARDGALQIRKSKERGYPIKQ